MALWIVAGLLFVGAVLLVLGLCCAAARGDRQLQRARRDLAGPQGRRRIGL
jgi:hypothetical protein